MNHKHQDRTQKQPITWRCGNPECAVDGQRFEFDSDYATCPKCKASPPIVRVKVLTHMIVPDPRGAVKGRYGRYRIVCDRFRHVAATTTNGEALSNNADVVNCPGCLEQMRKQLIRGTIGGRTLPLDGSIFGGNTK